MRLLYNSISGWVGGFFPPSASPANSPWCDWCSAEPDAAVATFTTHKTVHSFRCAPPPPPYYFLPLPKFTEDHRSWFLAVILLRVKDSGVALGCCAGQQQYMWVKVRERFRAVSEKVEWTLYVSLSCFLNLSSLCLVSSHLDYSSHLLSCCLLQRRSPQNCLKVHLLWFQ